MGKIIAGSILIVLGIGALFGVSLFNFLFAFLLIWIGIRIITGRGHHDYRKHDKMNTVSSEDVINEVGIFSEVNKTVKSENFKGGKIVMVFAGGKIDLSQVKTTQKTIDMEIAAVFGGGELIIPKNWKINSQGVSIFGGYDIQAGEQGGDVTLNLKGVAVFGGLKIRN